MRKIMRQPFLFLGEWREDRGDFHAPALSPFSFLISPLAKVSSEILKNLALG